MTDERSEECEECGATPATKKCDECSRYLCDAHEYHHEDCIKGEYLPKEKENADLRSQLAANAATIAAQAAEIERLTKRVQFLEDDDLQGMKIANKQAAELAALRSQLEEQRAALNCGMLFISNKIRVEYSHVAGGWKSEVSTHQDPIEFGVFESPIDALHAANWLAPHAEKDGGE